MLSLVLDLTCMIHFSNHFRSYFHIDLQFFITSYSFFEGEYPYLVVNNLHRSKFDANRDKPEATFGESVPERAWEEFHAYIDRSKAEIGGRGLFIDIHGHGHPNNWAELGYLIT